MAQNEIALLLLPITNIQGLPIYPLHIFFFLSFFFFLLVYMVYRKEQMNCVEQIVRSPAISLSIHVQSWEGLQ